LHTQGVAGHPGEQGGGTKKNNRKKMEGRGGGEAQGVADPSPPPKKNSIHCLPIEKSEAIATYKVMFVIPVNKVVRRHPLKNVRLDNLKALNLTLIK
jgi:hypothetical protein